MISKPEYDWEIIGFRVNEGADFKPTPTLSSYKTNIYSRIEWQSINSHISPFPLEGYYAKSSSFYASRRKMGVTPLAN